MLAGMEIPKGVTIIVKSGENLEYSVPGSKKSAKSRRWCVVFYGGKKKMVTDVVDAQDGCPVWNSEVNIDLVSPSDPVVMRVLDGDRHHIGQVIIPLAQIPRDGPPNFDPSRLRYSELEATKKNSYPRGRLVYWIWATSYWPAGTKLDSKSKGIRGSMSHLGKSKSRQGTSGTFSYAGVDDRHSTFSSDGRSSKAHSMVSGAYSESNLSGNTSYMGGGDPMLAPNGPPSSVAWTGRPGGGFGGGGTASYNPLASYDEEGSTRGSQHMGSDVDDPGRPPLYRSAMQLRPNQPGYAESTMSGYSAKRGLMRKMKNKLSRSTHSITHAVAKKAGGNKLYPDPHGSVLSVASSRENLQFPDSTSGQTPRPQSGSMTSLPRESYHPDGALRPTYDGRGMQDGSKVGSFESNIRAPETPPSNNLFLHAEERPNKPLEDMSHRELLSFALQQQRSSQVTRAELARVQGERDELSKKAEQSERELETVRSSLADLRFRLLTAGLTDFLELPAPGGRSTSLKFDSPFPGQNTRSAYSVGGFQPEPTSEVHQTFLDKLKKFGLSNPSDEAPSAPLTTAPTTTDWW